MHQELSYEFLKFAIYQIKEASIYERFICKLSGWDGSLAEDITPVLPSTDAINN